MCLFDFLNLVSGVCMFLFGMSLMGQALERRTGNGLKMFFNRLTTNKFVGLITGLGVTAIIQSSSATTVMVVGFVNSGLMTLRQASNVIMGANIGTTVTAWILSLAGIDSKNIFIRLLKPSSFSSILALIGIILYIMSKNIKKKDTGMILLGFATLMFGMETMSSAVAGLRYVPEFQHLFITFTNPILGVLVGAVLTAVIQSSSASVGILQALSSTGVVTYGAAVPIIMGQNIGTCVTALISSIGTSKNAKRAALEHLIFNAIGAAVWLTVFYMVKVIIAPIFLSESASLMGIAVFHSVFNILCTFLMLPFSGYLEKIVCLIIPDSDKAEKTNELDDRLLESPALALNQCEQLLNRMAVSAIEALKMSINCVLQYDDIKAEKIREAEDETDHFEDILGTYLVKLSLRQISEEESLKATEYMKLIGDYERIADHAVNILNSAEEMIQKNVTFSQRATAEYKNISSSVIEILESSYQSFSENDYEAAYKTEFFEQNIAAMKEELRTSHILRVQKGECSVDVGFVWSDLLTNLVRVSNHCSNISGSVIDRMKSRFSVHNTNNA